MSSSISIRGLDLWYGDNHALLNVSVNLPLNSITAIIGPSGCGKSTFLRCLNRMNDQAHQCHVTGEIEIDGMNIYGPGTDTIALRRKVGMVFQHPNPFPFSIWENVAYGPKMAGIRDMDLLDIVVKRSLEQAALYDEVKDRLDERADTLSGGQQQRLCIARALAMGPKVILLDEPCSALDPIATLKIEDLLHDLKKDYTIVIVTHNMQQASRCSDQIIFMYEGKLIEYGSTEKIFQAPDEDLTDRYISGKFG